MGLDKVLIVSMFWFHSVKSHLFDGAMFISDLLFCFFQDGKMNYAEHQTLQDRYHPINDAYSYCEVNLKYKALLCYVTFTYNFKLKM